MGFQVAGAHQFLVYTVVKPDVVKLHDQPVTGRLRPSEPEVIVSVSVSVSATPRWRTLLAIRASIPGRQRRMLVHQMLQAEALQVR